MLFLVIKVYSGYAVKTKHIFGRQVLQIEQRDNCPICAGLIVNEDDCLAKHILKLLGSIQQKRKITPFDIHSGNQTIKYGGNVIREMITNGKHILTIEKTEPNSLL